MAEVEPGQTGPTIATDNEVRLIPAPRAVEIMRAALLAHHRGELSGPARLPVSLGAGGLVFTVGGIIDVAYGFRVYGPQLNPHPDQFTAVWNASGRLLGIVVGNELGARRTGALGGVAVDVLARPDASTLGVVGSGNQAWTQVWAIHSVRHLSEIRVYSPNSEHRERFARRCSEELGVQASATNDARSSVEGADIVVMATRSHSPVIAAEWIAEGTHVSTLGSQSLDEHECPVALAERAALTTTDSLAQMLTSGNEPFIKGTAIDPVALSDIVAGAIPGRTSRSEISLYVSLGLAGTEPLLAQELWPAAARSREVDPDTRKSKS